jgi:hypothetical protein
MPSLARRATEIFSAIPPNSFFPSILAEIFSVISLASSRKGPYSSRTPEFTEVFSVNYPILQDNRPLTEIFSANSSSASSTKSAKGIPSDQIMIPVLPAVYVFAMFFAMSSQLFRKNTRCQ